MPDYTISQYPQMPAAAVRLSGYEFMAVGESIADELQEVSQRLEPVKSCITIGSSYPLPVKKQSPCSRLKLKQSVDQ